MQREFTQLLAMSLRRACWVTRAHKSHESIVVCYRDSRELPGVHPGPFIDVYGGATAADITHNTPNGTPNGVVPLRNSTATASSFRARVMSVMDLNERVDSLERVFIEQSRKRRKKRSCVSVDDFFIGDMDTFSPWDMRSLAIGQRSCMIHSGACAVCGVMFFSVRWMRARLK